MIQYIYIYIDKEWKKKIKPYQYALVTCESTWYGWVTIHDNVFEMESTIVKVKFGIPEREMDC